MALKQPAVLRFQSGSPLRKQFGERLRILVKEGSYKNHCYCLIADVVSLGRELGCDITVADMQISRKHVEFRWNGRTYEIKDLGSQNGFIHNGQATKEAILQAGDSLVIGLTVFEVIHPDTLSKALPGPVRSEGKISPRKNNQPTDPVVARKRLFVGLGLVLLMALIFSDPTERVKTFRERAKIDINPETEANKNVKKDDVKRALSDVVPNYKEDARGGDAEVFFKAGVRELQSKNFRRALTSFDTALAVDPNHDLAKVYKEITRKEFDKEVDLAIKAAIRARKALRYKEARMHYQTVLRYMSGDKLNVKYVEAEEALKLLDKIEHEGI